MRDFHKQPLRLCLTPGDPTGIGPEITARFLCEAREQWRHLSLTVIGSIDSIVSAAHTLGLTLPDEDSTIQFMDIAGHHPGDVSYQAVVRAVEHIAQGEADGLVTGPVSKANWADAGHPLQGHTELLQTLARHYWPNLESTADMLFLYKQFRMFLLTRHIPLADVSSTLLNTPLSEWVERCERLQTLLVDTLKLDAPNVGVLGVNPHAGEIGGTEDAQVLAPLIECMNRHQEVLWDGPLPADAAFRQFSADKPDYDAYVATYHDQGLIPMKLIAGYNAVNVTLGLPFIRTSVSHGTAADIVGLGIAKPDSLITAVDSLQQLLHQQQPALVTI